MWLLLSRALAINASLTTSLSSQTWGTEDVSLLLSSSFPTLTLLVQSPRKTNTAVILQVLAAQVKIPIDWVRLTQPISRLSENKVLATGQMKDANGPLLQCPAPKAWASQILSSPFSHHWVSVCLPTPLLGSERQNTQARKAPGNLALL